MAEYRIEKQITFEAEKAGWMVRKLQWVNRIGAPDRLFVKNGRVVFIEFKAPDKEVKGIQGREARRLAEHGAEVYGVNSIKHGREILGL